MGKAQRGRVPPGPALAWGHEAGGPLGTPLSCAFFTWSWPKCPPEEPKQTEGQAKGSPKVVLKRLPRLGLYLEALTCPDPNADRCFWKVVPGTSPPPRSLPPTEPSSWTRATVLQGDPVMFPVGPVTQPSQNQGRRLLPCQPGRGGGRREAPLGED